MEITVEMILEKKPCKEYTAERLGELVGDGKTLKQILTLEADVPLNDRIWCVTRFLDDKTNRAFAIWCARQCKTNVKEITNYIDVTEKFYDGMATEAELGAAYWAAYSAAYCAAANWSAYWAAYWAAANRAADRAAYWAAAYCAANRATERKKQVEWLLNNIN